MLSRQRARTTIIASAVALTIASVAAARVSLGAPFFHTHLESSEPMKDSTVTVAPTAIKLFFSEAVKPGVAGVRLLASDSSVVATGALTTGTGGKVPPLVATVTGSMKAGTYRVMWRVAGDDGHPVTGNFTFNYKPAR